MVVIIFSSPLNESNKKLLKGILPLLSNMQVEIYNAISKLSHRLRQPLEKDVIGLFITASNQELSDIHSLSFLLRNMKIILILPDKAEGTISKGHSLQPRFLGYLEDDFQDVAAVLDKMVKYQTAVETIQEP